MQCTTLNTPYLCTRRVILPIMLNENTVQVEGSDFRVKKSNIGHRSSQQQQANLEEKDTKMVEIIGSPIAVSRQALPYYCRIY